MATAFTAGVQPGGLRSLEEIQILICYMLNSIKEPIPLDLVPEIIAGNGMANFFDIGAAMEDLLKKSHITESEDGMLSIAAGGREIAETLFRNLPFSLRERSVSSALQLLARARSRKDSTATITQTADGYTVTCALHDGDKVMLSVTVQTADRLQADAIKANFLQDPTLLYRSTLAVLNGQIRQDAQSLHILL